MPEQVRALRRVPEQEQAPRRVQERVRALRRVPEQEQAPQREQERVRALRRVPEQEQAPQRVPERVRGLTQVPGRVQKAEWKPVRARALVANLTEADCLVILTDQSGLYTADPRKDPAAILSARSTSPLTSSMTSIAAW